MLSQLPQGRSQEGQGPEHVIHSSNPPANGTCTERALCKCCSLSPCPAAETPCMPCELQRSTVRISACQILGFESEIIFLAGKTNKSKWFSSIGANMLHLLIFFLIHYK